MRNPSNGTKVMIGIAAGLLTGALATASARAGNDGASLSARDRDRRNG